MYELVLASKSPRRRELLTEWGYDFRSLSIEVSEILNKNLNPSEQICDLARRKAEAARPELKALKSHKVLVLSADTVVILDQKIYGKPRDRAQATQFLQLLSGRTHQVITAFCFLDLWSDQSYVDHDQSLVEFKKLANQQIIDYVNSGEPDDKAGAYAIQGRGRALVQNFTGSYENIVGLPMQKISEVIKRYGWSIKQKPRTGNQRD